jgi:hypothetical protein
MDMVKIVFVMMTGTSLWMDIWNLFSDLLLHIFVCVIPMEMKPMKSNPVVAIAVRVQPGVSDEYLFLLLWG